jgi:hypothetical protein
VSKHLTPNRIEPPGPPIRCGLHHPGHDPHFIQVRLCCQESDPLRAARLVDLRSIEDDGWVTFEADGQVHRRWNHDPGRIRSAVDWSGGQYVEVSLRWSLLKVYRPDLTQAWAFSLAGSGSPCGPGLGAPGSGA